MEKLNFIYKRHSVRKYKDKIVPQNDIDEIIRAASFAPSGKNIQNWHFVVLKNKEKIQKIAQIIENKNIELANSLQDENLKKELTKFQYYHTIFKAAPVLILVFAGPYRELAVEVHKARNSSAEELNSVMRVSSSIQNISAALENLMLAASALGYGTCWMTGPVYAFKDIEEYIGFKKDGYFLASMTPLGVPEEQELNSPKRKSIEDILTIIE